jgi:hypothetical protein
LILLGLPSSYHEMPNKAKARFSSKKDEDSESDEEEEEDDEELVHDIEGVRVLCFEKFETKIIN